MQRYPNVSDTPDSYDMEGNKVCRNCKNLIGPGRQHYCSWKCMREFNRNNTWRYVRQDILRRDRWTCSICGERKVKKDLDVDHIIPVKWGGGLFDKKNLRTLCKECHLAKSKLDREALE